MCYALTELLIQQEACSVCCLSMMPINALAQLLALSMDLCVLAARGRSGTNACSMAGTVIVSTHCLTAAQLVVVNTSLIVL